MSEPKKYILNHIPGAFKMDDHWMHPKDNKMAPAPAGDYVRYEDYARLKAEVERLTGDIEVYREGVHKSDNLLQSDGIFLKDDEWVSDGIAQLIEQRNKAEAEVERLTKAGDAMDAYLKRQDGTTNGMLPCRQAWNAAKEGKQS